MYYAQQDLWKNKKKLRYPPFKFTPQQKFPQSDKDEDCGGSRDDEIVKGEKNNFLWFWG